MNSDLKSAIKELKEREEFNSVWCKKLKDNTLKLAEDHIESFFKKFDDKLIKSVNNAQNTSHIPLYVFASKSCMSVYCKEDFEDIIVKNVEKHLPNTFHIVSVDTYLRDANSTLPYAHYFKSSIFYYR